MERGGQRASGGRAVAKRRVAFPTQPPHLLHEGGRAEQRFILGSVAQRGSFCANKPRSRRPPPVWGTDRTPDGGHPLVRCPNKVGPPSRHLFGRPNKVGPPFRHLFGRPNKVGPPRPTVVSSWNNPRLPRPTPVGASKMVADRSTPLVPVRHKGRAAARRLLGRRSGARPQSPVVVSVWNRVRSRRTHPVRRPEPLPLRQTPSFSLLHPLRDTL